MRYSRQNKILELITNNDIETQDKLVAMLKSEGFDVTQATISRDIKELQLIKTLSSSGKYKYAVHNNEILNEKVLRVFASRRTTDGAVYKVKNINKEKIANTPERCFIDNSDVKEKKIPRHLNKNWYISLANKRLDDFLGEDCV